MYIRVVTDANLTDLSYIQYLTRKLWARYKNNSLFWGGLQKFMKKTKIIINKLVKESMFSKYAKVFTGNLWSEVSYFSSENPPKYFF